MAIMASPTTIRTARPVRPLMKFTKVTSVSFALLKYPGGYLRYNSSAASLFPCAAWLRPRGIGGGVIRTLELAGVTVPTRWMTARRAPPHRHSTRGAVPAPPSAWTLRYSSARPAKEGAKDPTPQHGGVP